MNNVRMDLKLSCKWFTITVSNNNDYRYLNIRHYSNTIILIPFSLIWTCQKAFPAIVCTASNLTPSLTLSDKWKQTRPQSTFTGINISGSQFAHIQSNKCLLSDRVTIHNTFVFITDNLWWQAKSKLSCRHSEKKGRVQGNVYTLWMQLSSRLSVYQLAKC